MKYNSYSQIITSLACSMLYAVKNNNGCTFNSSGNKPSSGYMVSVNDITKISEDELTASKLAGIVRFYYSAVQKSNHYFGLWSYSGLVYIDISVNIQSLDQAIQIGRENKQISIFDVQNNDVIML